MNDLLKKDLNKLVDSYKEQLSEIEDFILNPICILTKTDLLKHNEREKKIFKKYKVSNEWELNLLKCDIKSSIFQIDIFFQDYL